MTRTEAVDVLIARMQNEAQFYYRIARREDLNATEIEYHSRTAARLSALARAAMGVSE